MPVAATPRTWIGRSLARLEDEPFLRGEAKFVDDLEPEGLLHAVFVRSPFAHATVNGIDLSTALEAVGVLAILTGHDIADLVGSFPVNPDPEAEIRELTHPVLAGDRVRYVGQAVAVVVAETRAAALDAAELVIVDYDELEPVLEPGSGPPLHDDAPDNVLVRWRHAQGDVDRIIEEADVVVRAHIRMPRLIASPIEPRGVVASYDRATDQLTVWVSAQDQHRQLAGLSAVLKRDRSRLRVIVPHVGGAFGSKGVVAAETAAVALCAVRLGKPVKWIETRTENALGSYQGRGAAVDAELALSVDGAMLALRARYVSDLGAYLYSSGAIPGLTAGRLLTGCYAIPAAEVEVVGACTSKVPTGPYRGAGRPEAALVIERLVDLGALKLGIDPVELRRRNLIAASAFPYRTALGVTYDSGDFEGALEQALDLAGSPPPASPGRLTGTGVALYVERVAHGFESAAVSIGADSRVVCRIGSTPHGQGHETTFAQIAAEELGMEPDRIEIRWGDSAEIPPGVGTFGSRSVAVGGSALLLAAREARRRLEAGEALPIEVETRFEMERPAFSSGAYVAQVEVELETGRVHVRRVVAVDDCGHVVNPLLAEGQVVGATVQAVGECLYEETAYDDAGQPLIVNFASYLLPIADSVPDIVTALRETPTPLNPLGAKGIGEGGSIGTPPAIANAVCAALAPLGVMHLDLPFTPLRVWEAIGAARAAGEAAGE